MSKNTNFFGQSVFGQLISYIDNNIIFKNAQNHKANHYTKRFMASLNNFKFLSYNSVIKTKKLTYTPFFKTSANSYVKNVGF